jgi:FlaA1/EpsC-like NDP-sugar epimerase
MLIIDVALIYTVLLLSFSLRLGYFYIPFGEMYILMGIAPLIAIPIFIKFGLYRAIVRYIGFSALWTIVKAVSLYSIIWGLLALMLKIDGFPRSVVLINFLFTMLFIGSSRMVARWYFSENKKKFGDVKNIVIFGAKDTGIQLSYAIDSIPNLNPVFFIDQDPSLHGSNINGLKVFNPKDIGKLIKKYDVREVLLSMPNLSSNKSLEMVNSLRGLPLVIRIIPSIKDIASGKLKIEDLYKVNVTDLLGRQQIKPDYELLHKNITSKIVMVTGAGGSIGSELCRQIVSLNAEKLILFEQSEFALYSIDQELKRLDSKVVVVPILGSVTNKRRIEGVCTFFKVQTVYHAAAYKHVPMVEMNVSEGVRNNIFGTLYTAEAAIKSGVENYLLISTDKAVRPTNTMGVSKRISELVIQAIAALNHKTKFSMVRFGNVLGSSGSVIPLFNKQIGFGGPVTVTDRRITRFFMTIPEAVELVIQAGALGESGDVFVLDMGKPVEIYELARKMIHLSGQTVKDKSNPNGNIEITFTGLRPGEKLFEELLISNNALKTVHPMILKENEVSVGWVELSGKLEFLLKNINKNEVGIIRNLLKEIVSDFEPQCKIVDNTYIK